MEDPIRWTWHFSNVMCGKYWVLIAIDRLLGNMKNLDVILFVQSALAFGVAGLLWPEKFMALFDVLMFPWPASYRTIRLNSVAAIALALLLGARILAK
jgi:hypothetical protein